MLDVSTTATEVAAPINSFNVAALGLSGAVFEGAAALARHRADAQAYEAAVGRYAAGGDEADLWEELAALGFDRDEIQWHVDRPGRRIGQGYV